MYTTGYMCVYIELYKFILKTVDFFFNFYS